MTSAEPPGAAGAHRLDRLPVPIRPGTTTPTTCPRGHRLDIGGVQHGWCHDLHTRELVCETCARLPGQHGRWAQLDPTPPNQTTENHADPTRLQLIVLPPAARFGIGEIRLQLGTTILGRIELSLCEIDRTAVLTHLEVEPRFRRHGCGTVLLAAALARGPGYHWSSNPTNDNPITHAFTARTATPPPPARACTHQIHTGAFPPIAQWPTEWWRKPGKP